MLSCYIHINLTLELLYLLKKPHQKPSVSFKGLSINRERQWSTTFFLYLLCNDISESYYIIYERSGWKYNIDIELPDN